MQLCQYRFYRDTTPSINSFTCTTSQLTVLAVQPRRGLEGQEDLRAVGIGACVGHAEHAGVVVL